MTVAWSQRLWDCVGVIYEGVLSHPFLTGVVDGSLHESIFAYYVTQDAHYLRDYARALALVGSKAPSHEETARFAAHSASTYQVERSLHEVLLASFDLTDADLAMASPSPTTVAYTSHVLSVSATCTFAEGVAATLPCFWIYQCVGEALAERGSPNHKYQAWIDTYGGENFAASVRGVLQLVDRLGDDLSHSEAERAQRHFVTSARYEWMFWDAAWRKESWPSPSPSRQGLDQVDK